MSFSFASVILSYFLIAGGTWGAGLLAARFGIQSEYLGYLILAAGGFVGGMVAGRASKGTTIIEPAIGGGLLLVSLIAVGVIASGGSAKVMLVPAGMQAIGLTAGASAAGGIAGAFVAEKLFGNVEAGGGGWFLYMTLGGFGVGVVGTILGAAFGGSTVAMLGLLALCTLLLGLAAGASATRRILGASFLGAAVGLFGFFFLAIYLFMALFGSMAAERGGETGIAAIPAEFYAGLAVIAGGAGIVALIGAAIGWTTWGKSSGAK